MATDTAQRAVRAVLADLEQVPNFCRGPAGMEVDEPVCSLARTLSRKLSTELRAMLGLAPDGTPLPVTAPNGIPYERVDSEELLRAFADSDGAELLSRWTSFERDGSSSSGGGAGEAGAAGAAGAEGAEGAAAAGPSLGRRFSDLALKRAQEVLAVLQRINSDRSLPPNVPAVPENDLLDGAALLPPPAGGAGPTGLAAGGAGSRSAEHRQLMQPLVQLMAETLMQHVQPGSATALAVAAGLRQAVDSEAALGALQQLQQLAADNAAAAGAAGEPGDSGSGGSGSDGDAEGVGVHQRMARGQKRNLSNPIPFLSSGSGWAPAVKICNYGGGLTATPQSLGGIGTAGLISSEGAPADLQEAAQQHSLLQAMMRGLLAPGGDEASMNGAGAGAGGGLLLQGDTSRTASGTMPASLPCGSGGGPLGPVPMAALHNIMRTSAAMAVELGPALAHAHSAGGSANAGLEAPLMPDVPPAAGVVAKQRREERREKRSLKLGSRPSSFTDASPGGIDSGASTPMGGAAGSGAGPCGTNTVAGPDAAALAKKMAELEKDNRSLNMRLQFMNRTNSEQSLKIEQMEVELRALREQLAAAAAAGGLACRPAGLTPR